MMMIIVSLSLGTLAFFFPTRLLPVPRISTATYKSTANSGMTKPAVAMNWMMRAISVGALSTFALTNANIVE